MGVDAVADIRNVVVSNCVIRSSHRGLAVNLGQEGSFENILFSDCIVETRHFDRGWWGHGKPIYVNVGAWHNAVGRLRNVRFRNILCRSENGAYIGSDAPGLIAGVVLDGVRIELDRWSRWPAGEYDRRPTPNGPEVYAHPTSGIHIDTATDVTLRNCEVVWAGRRALRARGRGDRRRRAGDRGAARDRGAAVARGGPCGGEPGRGALPGRRPDARDARGQRSR